MNKLDDNNSFLFTKDIGKANPLVKVYDYM